jgi:hypothetical protein
MVLVVAPVSVTVHPPVLDEQPACAAAVIPALLGAPGPSIAPQPRPVPSTVLPGCKVKSVPCQSTNPLIVADADGKRLKMVLAMTTVPLPNVEVLDV